jgi:GWxTD domain-containing protein
MTPLEHWVHTPAAGALGWTLVHFIWEGAVVALVAAVVLWLARSSRVRYAAACLALAAMLVSFGFTWAYEASGQPAYPKLARLDIPPAPERSGPDGGGLPSPGLGISALLAWLAPLWIGGVAFFQLRAAAGWIGVRRLRRRGVCGAEDAWQWRLNDLAARLRVARPVRLLESCLAEVPVVIGWLRPAILMPLGLMAGMPAAQVEAILIHELAHVRRHDYLVNVLQTLAENLLFYHPATWWISRVIRAEREHCCDDWVLAMNGDAREYATALTALEERRFAAQNAAPAATGGNLVKRIRRLLYRDEKPRGGLTPVFSAGVLTIAAAVALAAWPAAPPEPQTPVPAPQATARAQAPAPYQKWLDEDVLYIITPEERTAFLTLRTDEEREHFIEQFWLRRDPTPGTPANEFKIQHYRRIAYANEHFASSVPGWRTDRGRIYIVYGPPDEIETHPTGAGSKPPYEQWLYHHIEGIGDNVTVEFVDQNRSGDYRMTMDPNGRLQMQAPPPYQKWLDGDVAYIITSEERAAFLALQTDEEREHFIEQFWLRRDPTPGTMENEFKEEHYRRIAYANEHFASNVPGWQTDRGRIYIVYGPPDEIESHPTATDKPPYEQWLYHHIEGIGDNVKIEFVDQNRSGDYRMTVGPARQLQARFALDGPGARVTVEITRNRRIRITVPTDFEAASYNIAGVVRSTAGPTVSTFQDSVDRPGDYLLARSIAPGTYVLNVTVTDAAGTMRKDYTCQLHCAVAVTKPRSASQSFSRSGQVMTGDGFLVGRSAKPCPPYA